MRHGPTSPGDGSPSESRFARWSIAAAALAMAASGAAAAPSDRFSTAKLFPWVVSDADAPNTCLALLDPGQLVKASTGALVYLNYGAGAQLVDSHSVHDLMGHLAAPRVGTPDVTTVKKTSQGLTLLARDVGPRDAGGIRCWFIASAGQWRLYSIEIITAQGATR